jgi:hypothetical protein
MTYWFTHKHMKILEGTQGTQGTGTGFGMIAFS